MSYTEDQGQEMVPLMSSANNNYNTGNTSNNSNNSSYTQASRFGIPMESYKQGFLNVIARYNTSSQSSNLSQSVFNRFRRSQTNQSDQMTNIREQRIRAALQSVIDMPQGTLGNYSGAQALSNALVNYGNWISPSVGKNMKEGFASIGDARRTIGAKTRGIFGMGGKKTRRNKKSKKSRKH